MRGRLLAFACSAAVLSACGSVVKPTDAPNASGAQLVSSSAPTTLPYEQLPSELSVDYFSKMPLKGTGLTLISVLDDNAKYTRHQIQYWSNGLLISGILNIPKGEGPFPLLLLNHGYIAPSIYTNGRGLKREQDYLAREGFAVLHSDYRGHAFSDESPDERKVYDAGLEYSMDVINAINAVKDAKLPNIDTNHIGMMGHSMGGGVTLNILTAYPDLVDAAVLYAPVHSDAYENFNRWRREREEDDRTVVVMGNDRTEHPELWDQLSSLTHLSAIHTPIMLFQGTSDDDVPAAWSDFLDAKLTELGKVHTYVLYQGEEHEFGPQWTDFMKKTAEFYKQNFAEPEPKTL